MVVTAIVLPRLVFYYALVGLSENSNYRKSLGEVRLHARFFSLDSCPSIELP